MISISTCHSKSGGDDTAALWQQQQLRGVRQHYGKRGAHIASYNKIQLFLQRRHGRTLGADQHKTRAGCRARAIAWLAASASSTRTTLVTEEAYQYERCGRRDEWATQQWLGLVASVKTLRAANTLLQTSILWRRLAYRWWHCWLYSPLHFNAPWNAALEREGGGAGRRTAAGCMSAHRQT